MASDSAADPFGELRSLRASHDETLEMPTHHWRRKGTRERLWALLQESHVRGPERHLDEVVPYVAGWYADPYELATCRDLDALEAAVAIAPFASFALNLRASFRGDDGVRALLASPAAPRLVSLSLEFCALTGEGVRELAHASALGALRELDLGDNPEIGEEGVSALARARALGALETLSLSSCRLTPSDALVIAHGRAFESLRKLDLQRNRLGDEGALALAEATRLTGLRALVLDENGIGFDAGRALVRSRSFPNLTSLDLIFNAMSEEEGVALEGMARRGSRVICVIDE